jgi:hypothetical protein
MAEAFTCHVDLFDNAPAKRVLRGDKLKKAEPAQHVIEFPGGAVEVSRCEDGSYWTHIIINRDPLYSGPHKGRASAHGEVIDSRIDWHERGMGEIPAIPEGKHLTQIAVRIMPVREEGR